MAEAKVPQLDDKHLERMICCCASHMDSDKRLNRFKLMLESWNTQTVVSVIPLWISMSFETKKLEQEVDKLIAEYAKVSPLVLFKSTSKKSQFQHYAFLIEKIKSHRKFKSTLDAGFWIMFTDDDDTWEKDRVWRYALKIAVIDVNYKGMFVRAIGNTTDSKSTEGKHLGDFEYVNFVIPFQNLQCFLQRSSPELLKSSLADLYLVRFLLSPTDLPISIMIINTKRLLYNYFQPEIGSSLYYCPSSHKPLYDTPFELNSNEFKSNEIKQLSNGTPVSYTTCRADIIKENVTRAAILVAAKLHTTPSWNQVQTFCYTFGMSKEAEDAVCGKDGKKFFKTLLKSELLPFINAPVLTNQDCETLNLSA